MNLSQTKMNFKLLKRCKNKFKNKRLKFLRKFPRAKFRKYMKKELEMSTTHGLIYFVNNDIHWFERLFWVASFIFCLCLVYVLLAPLYARYRKSPTVTSVEMDYFNWNVSYPAITLCPDFKTNDEAFSTLAELYMNNTGVELSSYLWSISNVNIHTIERVDLQTPEIVKMIPPEDYATIAASTFLRFDPQFVTTNTNWPIRVEAAMTEMGMCHVINSNVAVFDDPFKWKLQYPATYHKDNIQLSVYDGEFFIQVMNYADIYKIFIHSPDEVISSSTASYTHIKESYLALGVLVSTTRITQQVQESSISFRKCRLPHEPMNKRYPVYSYNHCLMECRIKIIKKLCGCIPHFYNPQPHERICSLLNLTCLVKYKAEIMSLSVTEETLSTFSDIKDLPRSSNECECPTNCEGTIYLKDQETMIPQSSITRVRIGLSSYPKIRIMREVIFGFYDIIYLMSIKRQVTSLSTAVCVLMLLLLLL